MSKEESALLFIWYVKRSTPLVVFLHADADLRLSYATVAQVSFMSLRLLEHVN